MRPAELKRIEGPLINSEVAGLNTRRLNLPVGSEPTLRRRFDHKGIVASRSELELSPLSISEN
jgi:hypothetical protein